MTQFNMKKHAKETSYKNYNRMLEERREDFNLEAEEGPPNVNQRLTVKDKDNTLLYEGQLEEARTDTRLVITDKALDTEAKVYVDKRNDQWDTDVQCIDKATEAENQKSLKDYKAAEDKQTFDTSFWDEYVGVQLEGDVTKVKVNTQKSQLQNKAERFKGLDKDDAKDIADYDKNKAMVFASLKDADAMLFHIYARAISEGREINEREKQIVTDINVGKAGVLKKKVS
tara:strand:- start:19674 stop:20357 length:684 start_codon:yes stop_codon:yes gene_type:complete